MYFAQSDISTVRPIVKHMNIVDAADGMASYFESKQETDEAYQLRLLNVAQDRLRVLKPFCISYLYSFFPLSFSYFFFSFVLRTLPEKCIWMKKPW